MFAAAPLSAADKPFRAGAAVVDITPLKFPVIANGGFTERLATQAVDRLHARCGSGSARPAARRSAPARSLPASAANR